MLIALLCCPAVIVAQQMQMLVLHAVPNLSGDSLAQADVALKEAGLTRGDVQGPQASEAYVIGQSVPTGTQVRAGTAIALTLALPQKIPSALLVVPALAGLTEAQALSALTGPGMRAGNINGPLQGIVTAQQPEAGSRVLRETPVDLTFALRPKPALAMVTVPLLEGRTEAEAAKMLGQAGLQEDGFAARSNRKVISQAPEAGDRVRRGTQVHLSMASGLTRWTVIATLIPLLTLGGWLVLKLMHPVPPIFSLVAHGGSATYSQPWPQVPQIRFRFSLRERTPLPRYRTAKPPQVRRQGERL